MKKLTFNPFNSWEVSKHNLPGKFIRVRFQSYNGCEYCEGHFECAGASEFRLKKANGEIHTLNYSWVLEIDECPKPCPEPGPYVELIEACRLLRKYANGIQNPSEKERLTIAIQLAEKGIP